MVTHLRVTSLLVILGTILLFGCATPTQRSADITSHEPHPSPVDNFQIVIPDGVYRSGQPKVDDQEEIDWKYLKEIGVKTIVKLNGYPSNVGDKEIKKAEKYDIKIIPLYMQPEDNNWFSFLWAKPEIETVMQAVNVLENRGNGKVLVHCAHGKDRTGLVVAIYSVRNKHYCKDAAYNEMLYYGHSTILTGIKRVLDDPSIVENPGCTHAYK